jgi:hypothetical protein
MKISLKPFKSLKSLITKITPMENMRDTHKITNKNDIENVPEISKES